MSGLGFIILGIILVGAGILGLFIGLVVLGRRKKEIKEEQIHIQEEGL